MLEYILILNIYLFVLNFLSQSYDYVSIYYKPRNAASSHTSDMKFQIGSSRDKSGTSCWRGSRFPDSEFGSLYCIEDNRYVQFFYSDSWCIRLHSSLEWHLLFFCRYIPSLHPKIPDVHYNGGSDPPLLFPHGSFALIGLWPIRSVPRFPPDIGIDTDRSDKYLPHTSKGSLCIHDLHRRFFPVIHSGASVKFPVITDSVECKTTVKFLPVLYDILQCIGHFIPVQEHFPDRFFSGLHIDLVIWI